MSLPSARRLWRRAVRAILNPGWKERTLRGRQLREAVTRFQHRTIHRDLTPDILRSISDDDLIQAVYDCVEASLPAGHVGLIPADTGLPRGCTATYYYRTMDYDVWNGGFDQFLDGAGPEATASTVEGLRFLGLTEMADVVEEAQKCFAAGQSTSRWDVQHAEIHPSVEPSIIRFIREHPHEFTTIQAV